MAETFSYRPKNYSIDQLKKIAQKNHVNLNRYIEEAVVEKIQNEKMSGYQESLEQLTRKISQVVVEHMGVKLLKPDAKTHSKINKKFDETTQNGKWVSDKNARPGR